MSVNPIFGAIDFLLMVDRLSESALRPVLCFGLLPDYRLFEPPMVIILEIHQKPVRSLPLASPPHSTMNSQGQVASTIKPRRPLSAYNLFFQAERQKMIAEREAAERMGTTPKVGFSGLAKTIAARWNKIDPHEKAHFEVLAREEKIRYKRAVSLWKKAVKQQKKLAKNGTAAPASARSQGGAAIQNAIMCNSSSMNSQVSPSSSNASLMNTNTSCSNLDIAAPQGNEEWNAPLMMNTFDMNFPFPQEQQQQQGPLFPMEPLSPYSVKMLNQGIDILASELQEDCVDLFVSLFQQ